ncbi:hypothetical protein SAMN05443252_104103 [Bacillus sp. OV322]|uniref:hypothetical protein n=1 Tax=Bacillus sp. OV322 TaxID=1882764 RepID=UPI0008ED01BE|nr:hypothetical protein [Bacillus sp. OV322]SFC52516.1 hypothetical protein SAMN05443252_104103 [Bacillus sp. OV322]
MRGIIVLASLCIANLNYVLYNSLGLNPIEKSSIRIISISLLLFSILIQKNAIKIRPIDLVWFFFSMTALFGFSFNDKIFNFSYLLLVIIVSRSISIDKYYKYFNYFNLFVAFLLIIFLQLGITQNVEQIIGDRVRSTFGFNNVNAFSNLEYSILMVYLLSRKTIKLTHIIINLIVLTFIFNYTDTRSVLYSILIFLLFYFILRSFMKENLKYKNVLKGFITIICIIPLVLSVVSPFLLKNYPILDKIFSLRLTLNTFYLETNTMKTFLLGGTTERDVDNGYLLLLCSMGITFFIFSLVLIVKSLNILIDAADSKSVSFIISFLYYNALESLLVRPELFIGLLFWMLIYKTATEKRDRGKALV